MNKKICFEILNLIEQKKAFSFPYVIGISGNIGVGKSTYALKLKKQLKQNSQYSIQIISTDDFLYSNQELKKQKNFQKKGWPITYNKKR